MTMRTALLVAIAVAIGTASARPQQDHRPTSPRYGNRVSPGVAVFFTVRPSAHQM
jgi:hypothetical protein